MQGRAARAGAEVHQRGDDARARRKRPCSAGVPSMFRTLLSYRGSGGAEIACDSDRRRGACTGTGARHCALRTRHDPRSLWPDRNRFVRFLSRPADQPQGFGTIGRPTDRVEFRLQRDGRAVAAGETGELQIRTPFGMLGYLDNPELTAASFDGDYFRTGDLARMTAGGYVELVGRAKDIISRGGNKIAPLEIDNLLAEHPDIAAALCAGVPDERLGEVIHAVIVPRAGAAIDTARCATGSSRAPSASRCRTSFISATRCRADRAARPTAGRSRNEGDVRSR